MKKIITCLALSTFFTISANAQSLINGNTIYHDTCELQLKEITYEGRRASQWTEDTIEVLETKGFKVMPEGSYSPSALQLEVYNWRCDYVGGPVVFKEGRCYGELSLSRNNGTSRKNIWKRKTFVSGKDILPSLQGIIQSMLNKEEGIFKKKSLSCVLK